MLLGQGAEICPSPCANHPFFVAFGQANFVPSFKQIKTNKMRTFNVPSKDTVSPANAGIFDNLHKALGFVPNLYAVMAYSETALGKYLAFQTAKTSLTNKEKEAVNLVVSQINGCSYCQSAHTLLGKMNGLTEEETLNIRGGGSTDVKLDALVKFAKAVTETKGRVNEATLDAFYHAGYTNANLVDVIMLVGDKIIMNYLHNLTEVPVDFPLAQPLG
jgi:uncharacterized peroxidase-related enzyme